MCSIVNPWTNISWENTIAQIDKEHLIKIKRNGEKVSVLFGSEEYVNHINRNDIKDGKETDNPIKLNFKDCLPEPFSGDINSEVYCLCMNPGDPDSNFCSANDKKREYEKQVNLILEQSLGPHQLLIPHYFDNMMFDEQIIKEDKKAFVDYFFKGVKSSSKPHLGAIWQRNVWNPLIKELKMDPCVFIIEYFPYHSHKGFNFPKDLPSYKYRNQLIRYAMEKHKLIVIMRKEEDWYNIEDENLGIDLKKYPNKILLKGNQRLKLSRNSFCRDVDISIFEKEIPNWVCKNMDEVIDKFKL